MTTTPEWMDVPPLTDEQLTALERFKRYGHVPVMRGGSEGATEAGGGAEANGAPEPSGLYQEALQGVPADLHPYVEEHFKKWDSQVTPKLQEAAQIRDKFGPLADIEGLTDVPAEELSELIKFREVMGDPNQLVSWMQQVNEALTANGIDTGFGGGELDEEAWVKAGEENGWFEGGEEEQQGPNLDSLKQELLETLRGELEPVKKFMGTEEQERAAEKAKAEIQQRMSALEEQHGELDDEQRDAVYQLAYAHNDSEDPIGAAFEQYLKITGRAEGNAVDGKLSQPNGALNGGRQSADAPKTSWGGGEGTVNPKAVALERMRQAAGA